MLYQIIKTRTSADRKILYSLFTTTVSQNNINTHTYGIIASDCNGTISTNDIITDRNNIIRLLNILCENSIKPRDVSPYVNSYLSLG